MQWNVTSDVGYILRAELDNKAVRLGVSTSAIIRTAIIEYLERNPTENEREELAKYPKHHGSAYD